MPDPKLVQAIDYAVLCSQRTNEAIALLKTEIDAANLSDPCETWGAQAALNADLTRMLLILLTERIAILTN